METLSMWENMVLGVIVLGVLFLFTPNIKSSMRRNRDVPSDWMAAILPIGLVVLFVVFLLVVG
ncbi:MAG: hypothetical protein ABGX69_05965 [Methylococcales bacterium]|nr:hypothetical protein [Methylococcaceae bacterium]HIL40570.1 hypothetical protein [Methylococcales bacterium]